MSSISQSPIGPILRGKVAIITGSNSGLGAASARLFAHCGASVVITGRDGDNIRKVAEECRQLATNKDAKFLELQGDIGDAAFRQKLVEQTIATFGKLDILVNNAGIGGADSVLKPNLELLDEIFNTNLKAVYHLTSISVPHLLKTKGNIVNISSCGGVKPFPSATSYTSLKAALDHFTRNVAAELGPQQIRVNSINPGSVPTTTNFNRFNQKLTQADVDMRAQMHALNRVGLADEVANAVAFIASDLASFITGNILLVDGGLAVKSQPLNYKPNN